MVLILVFPYLVVKYSYIYPTWLLPAVIIDVTIFVYFIKMVRLSLFSFCMTMHSSISYGGFFKNQNSLLRNALVHSRKKITNGITMLTQTLALFIYDHTYFSMIIVYVDQEVWAKILAVAIGCQIPSNIYLLNRFLMYDNQFEIGINIILTLFITINQIMMLLTSLILIARYSKLITI